MALRSIIKNPRIFVLTLLPYLALLQGLGPSPVVVHTVSCWVFKQYFDKYVFLSVCNREVYVRINILLFDY